MAQSPAKQGRLAGSAALITGGARGIGGAIATLFAREGANVWLTDILDEAGEAHAKSIGARYHHHDVADEKDWQHIAAHLDEEHGGLDILVNNAGVYMAAPVMLMELAEWRSLMAVNLDGVFLGCKHMVPLLKKRGGAREGGSSLINISSMAGINGAAGHSAYCASKGGVRLLTKALALELAAEDPAVRVNSIHPGVIESDMGDAVTETFMQVRGQDKQTTLGEIAALHPLRRMGHTQEVARAALWLASSESSFSTGSELVIDGGVTAG